MTDDWCRLFISNAMKAKAAGIGHRILTGVEDAAMWAGKFGSETNPSHVMERGVGRLMAGAGIIGTAGTAGTASMIYRAHSSGRNGLRGRSSGGY